MSTKIGGFDSSPVRISTGRTVKRADEATQSSQTGGADTPVAESHITDSARTLAALDKLVQDMPAIDQSRVESVQNSLANGTYQIDAERIADRLLQTEQTIKHIK